MPEHMTVKVQIEARMQEAVEREWLKALESQDMVEYAEKVKELAEKYVSFKMVSPRKDTDIPH